MGADAQGGTGAEDRTGPYNGALDPITVDQWCLLARTEVMEMTNLAAGKAPARTDTQP